MIIANFYYIFFEKIGFLLVLLLGCILVYVDENRYNPHKLKYNPIITQVKSQFFQRKYNKNWQFIIFSLKKLAFYLCYYWVVF
jgi:hypothetical protein